MQTYKKKSFFVSFFEIKTKNFFFEKKRRKKNSWMIGYKTHGFFDDTNTTSEEEEEKHTKPNIKQNEEHFSKKPFQRFRRNVSLRQKKEAAYRQSYLCFYCCDLLLPSYQVDHYIPLWQGGENKSSNLVATCGNCHNEKTAIENDRQSPFFRTRRKRKNLQVK